MRASLATVATGATGAAPRARPPPAALPAADRGGLVAAARAVGDRLETLAIRRERDATWLGLNLLDDQHWVVAPLGVDLYDGVPGVALFLAQLGAVTGEERYSALARAALARLRAQVPRLVGQLGMVGAFSGWGGVVYAYTHLAALWREPGLLDAAERLVDAIGELVPRDDQLDVIGGSAGALVALLGLHRARPSARTLEVARACGDRLDARAEPVPGAEGRAVSSSAARRPLAGVSHGAAGMAWALLQLAAATGEERYRGTALEMIRYERNLFSPEARNWLDLRAWVVGEAGTGEPRASTTFWCHGAPGVGLARLCSLEHVDDAATREEIGTALQTTLASGFGHGHALCHGDLGNLELLLQASRAPDGHRWREEAERIASALLASIEAEGWRCGNPLEIESPGLMTGLAGIGHGALAARGSHARPRSAQPRAARGRAGVSSRSEMAASRHRTPACGRLCGERLNSLVIAL